MRSTAPCRRARSRSFVATRRRGSEVVAAQGGRLHRARRSRPAVTAYVAQRTDQRRHFRRSRVWSRDIANQVNRLWLDRQDAGRGESATSRNDMYLALGGDPLPDEGQGEPIFKRDEIAALNAYKSSLDNATKFIPTWVKIAVAIALGLGTMVGWKRIVVTVGEKIGKTPSDLCAGRLRRAGRGGDHRRCRRVRPAGFDHARPVVGRRRHHGGERIRAADGDGAQHRTGLGADAAGGELGFIGLSIDG